MSPLHPVDDGFKQAVRIECVSIYRMSGAFNQRFDNRGWRREIHIRHPCRYHIRFAEHGLPSVVFSTASSFPPDYLIEVTRTESISQETLSQRVTSDNVCWCL